MRALSLIQPRTLEFIDAPAPGAPAVSEVLVAVRAVGICGTDISGYLGKMPFIQCPRILGHELGVEILAVGQGVPHLKPGGHCSVEPYLDCGQCHACRQGKTNCCERLEVLGVHRDGGLCEKLLLPARKLHPSAALSFEQLALVETLAIGCHAVDRAGISENDDALVIGAGPIGLSVIEFARLQTPRLRVVETNARRRAFVEAHYPGVEVLELPPLNEPAQVVFDATGHPAAMAASLSLARFTGRVVFVGITKEPVPLDDPLFHRRELTLLASRNAPAADFPRIIALIESGRIDTRPWITHRGGLDELPALMPEWVKPQTGVVKAVVELAAR